MMWGGGVSETGPELLQLYAQKWMFDSEGATLQQSSGLLDPISPHRGSTKYPRSTTSHFEYLLPDTIHLLPASCIFADTITVNWCHAVMWEVLHLINCCVTPFDKNVLSLILLEATTEFLPMWNLACEWLKTRGGSVWNWSGDFYAVVEEQKKKLGSLWMYSEAVGLHKWILV